jgi:hypothetical protein
MADFGKEFGDIARGLLSLEVNTIIKANMVAVRMPSAPLDALAEIAKDYGAWLRARHVAVDGPSSPVTQADFDRLGASALTLRDRPGLAASDGLLAQRIVDNAAQLSAIFGALTGPKPSPDVIVQMRKAWEIGTEQVAMQTVLWIDGDVTNRVIPEYAGSDAVHLLAVHSLAVKSAISMWDTLASVVKSVFESVWLLVTK